MVVEHDGDWLEPDGFDPNLGTDPHDYSAGDDWLIELGKLAHCAKDRMRRDPQREDCARFHFATTVQTADIFLQLAGYCLEDGELVNHPEQLRSIQGIHIHDAGIGGMDEGGYMNDLAATLDITMSLYAADRLLHYVKQQQQAGGSKSKN
ncbi:hypothetical protein GC177_01050 [bacterium]|nr:hypothetical protein [bacterium]